MTAGKFPIVDHNGSAREISSNWNQPSLHSRLTGPIKNQSFLRRSLLLAELSLLAYLPPAETANAVADIGFTDTVFFNQKGAQAYWFQNAWDAVIVCRGTEAHDWYDIRANVNVWMEVAETVGRVHRGFKREMDRLWPRVEAALVDNRKPLWFAGHSLGGAMATICAGRCKLSFIRSNPEELYTYGSPRVGDGRYVRFSRLRHHRWVNNNDIVPTVPPTWLGYRHSGREWYLDHRGRLKQLAWSGRMWDSLKGRYASLRQRRLGMIADHSMFDYIAAIKALCLAEESSCVAEHLALTEAPESSHRQVSSIPTKSAA